MYFEASGPRPAEIAVQSGLWGRELQGHVRDTFGFEVGVGIYGDMLPKLENSILLGKSKDEYGDPVPSIQMSFGDFERRSVDRGAQVGQDLLKRMGASEIRKRGPGMGAGHLMGTTRMGKDAANSVCDEWGRCHDLDNVFVAGSSLFSTAGCSNPTMTIAALAVRTSDFLARSL
jgi:choline dehydrogenase-like flavoprotein